MHPYCQGYLTMKATIVVFLLFITLSAHAQSDPPTVGVSFQIEAPLYKNELGEAVRPVEIRLGNYVRTTFAGKAALGFLRWNQVQGGEGHMLRLVIEEASSSLGPEIRLRIFGTIDGVETDLSNFDLEHFNPLVFDVFAQKYAQDPDRLGLELERQLGILMNDSFYDALQAAYLNALPLTFMIELDENGRRLIVPLRYAAISPEKESRLRVEFTSTQIGDPREGTMSLSLAGKGRLPHFDDDGLDCEIASFKYPAITFSSAEAVLDQWNLIADVLGKDNLTQAALFMENYIPAFFVNTANGLVLDEPLP